MHEHVGEGPVIVVAGGGTGGHLYPALAIADAVRELRPDARVVFVGAERGLERTVLPGRGEEHLLVPVRGIDRTRRLAIWGALPALARSVLRVWSLFVRLRPSAAVLTGGYAAAPAGIVAALRGVPIVVQEQNSVPGATTRLLARFAARVHVAFPEAAERLGRRARARSRVTGNPVRPPAAVSATEARAGYGLSADAIVLLVTGGSQGARALNRVLTGALEQVARGVLGRPDRLEILWATGPRHYEGVGEALAGLGVDTWVHPRPYLDDMPSALAAADLALSRAGAMTTAELLNQGLPALLVPLPTAAADHQRHNAEALASAGAAVLMHEAELTPEGLWSELSRLVGDEVARASMRAVAERLARPNAAADIADDVAGLLPGPERAR